MGSRYKIAVITDGKSWINPYIPKFLAELSARGHAVSWIHEVSDIPVVDFLFILSCFQLIPVAILSRNRHNLVVHQSDLPQGRGWSPLPWQILQGANVIPVCLFEAAPAVDSGIIYYREELRFQGTELIDDLRQAQAAMSIKLSLDFVRDYPEIIDRGVEQTGVPTYFPRRGTRDSRLDPDKTIREQFNLLRIIDNEHYPALFEIEGETYILKIEKASSGVNRSGEQPWTTQKVATQQATLSGEREIKNPAGI